MVWRALNSEQSVSDKGRYRAARAAKNSRQQDLSCKSFRIKRVNCDIDQFVTNVCKSRIVKLFMEKGPEFNVISFLTAIIVSPILFLLLTQWLC